MTIDPVTAAAATAATAAIAKTTSWLWDKYGFDGLDERRVENEKPGIHYLPL